MTTGRRGGTHLNRAGPFNNNYCFAGSGAHTTGAASALATSGHTAVRPREGVRGHAIVVQTQCWHNVQEPTCLGHVSNPHAHWLARGSNRSRPHFRSCLPLLPASEAPSRPQVATGQQPHSATARVYKTRKKSSSQMPQPAGARSGRGGWRGRRGRAATVAGDRVLGAGLPPPRQPGSLRAGRFAGAKALVSCRPGGASRARARPPPPGGGSRRHRRPRGRRHLPRRHLLSSVDRCAQGSTCPLSPLTPPPEVVFWRSPPACPRHRP